MVPKQLLCNLSGEGHYMETMFCAFEEHYKEPAGCMIFFMGSFKSKLEIILLGCSRWMWSDAGINLDDCWIIFL